MALVGVELKTLVSEPDALTTRPPPCAHPTFSWAFLHVVEIQSRLTLSTISPAIFVYVKP